MAQSDHADASTGATQGPRPAAPSRILRVELTTYHFVQLDDSESWADELARWPGDRKISLSGGGFMTLPRAFLAGVEMEGYGLLKVGGVDRLISLTKDGWLIESRTASAPWGFGAYNNPLVPWRSIAVDPKLVPLKTEWRLLDLIGHIKPDGNPFDGLVTAADTGGAIPTRPDGTDGHIDLFVGTIHQRVSGNRPNPWIVSLEAA